MGLLEILLQVGWFIGGVLEILLQVGGFIRSVLRTKPPGAKRERSSRSGPSRGEKKEERKKEREEEGRKKERKGKIERVFGRGSALLPNKKKQMRIHEWKIHSCIHIRLEASPRPREKLAISSRKK